MRPCKTPSSSAAQIPPVGSSALASYLSSPLASFCLCETGGAVLWYWGALPKTTAGRLCISAAFNIKKGVTSPSRMKHSQHQGLCHRRGRHTASFRGELKKKRGGYHGGGDYFRAPLLCLVAPLFRGALEIIIYIASWDKGLDFLSPSAGFMSILSSKPETLLLS